MPVNPARNQSFIRRIDELNGRIDFPGVAVKTTQMTREELLSLPVTVDLTAAGRALGLGRTLAYDLAKRGQFPVRVLRLGAKYRVSRADLLRYLGEEPTEDRSPAVA